MAKKNLPKLDQIKSDFPTIKFIESDSFYWSARDGCVYFNNTAIKRADGLSQLLHEIGHALKDHQKFTSGIQLLKMEAEAWSQARQLAAKYDLTIDEDHIDDCLNSYRDWLHARSLCPACQALGVETDDNKYNCLNCGQKWSTPVDQRTRCYRKKI